MNVGPSSAGAIVIEIEAQAIGGVQVKSADPNFRTVAQSWLSVRPVPSPWRGCRDRQHHIVVLVPVVVALPPVHAEVIDLVLGHLNCAVGNGSPPSPLIERE